MSARKGRRVEQESARRFRALGLDARRVPLSGIGPAAAMLTSKESASC